MTQYLEAKIPVPDDCVIISKVEYEELRKASEKGNTMKLPEFATRIGRSSRWVVDNILNNPKFKKSLDVQSGGFIYYREDGRDSYVMLRSEALEFIEKNFRKIYMR